MTRVESNKQSITVRLEAAKAGDLSIQVARVTRARRVETRVDVAGGLGQPVGVIVNGSERLYEQTGEQVERVDDGKGS